MTDELDDDEPVREIEIIFWPRLEALAARGITDDEFKAALLAADEERDALAVREDVDEEGIPGLEDMVLQVRGVSYRLGDLADVEIRGDLPWKAPHDQSR